MNFLFIGIESFNFEDTDPDPRTIECASDYTISFQMRIILSDSEVSAYFLNECSQENMLLILNHLVAVDMLYFTGCPYRYGPLLPANYFNL